MRNILSILLFLMISHAAIADCDMRDVEIYPKQFIEENSLIIIELYSVVDADWETLKETQFYLESEDGFHKIELEEKELLIGEMYMYQRVFLPKEDLGYGSYTLKIKKPTEENKFLNKKTVWKNRGLDPFGSDTSISFIDYEYVEYGCSPVEFGRFKVIGLDKEKFVKATVYKKSGTSSFYVFSNENEIAIGHDFCAGAFEFNKGEKISVSFEIQSNIGQTIKVLDGFTFKARKG